MNRRRLEEAAAGIFGDDPEAVRRWADYWGESAERNRRLLQQVRPLALVDFRDRLVLDVGCGAGGLAEVVTAEGARYVGLDYHRHVLELSAAGPARGFVQGSGTRLPFRDASFDYVAAFDVLEHLVGGYPRQVECLRELRRVLRPLGMIFLTTPNRWYPYEAHSGLYGPQYLPGWLADRYIAWRNPAFLREHRSFREIPMLTPRQLRRALREAGLAWLHDLPCGLDRRQYRRLFRWRGLLSRVGLGWYPHAEFWGILVRREQQAKLRLKRPLEWSYEPPATGTVSDFQPSLDFDRHPFGHQLGPGWHWHERDRRGFRWASPRARAYLQSEQAPAYLLLEGFSPEENELETRVEGWTVGRRRLRAGEPFQLRYLLPFAGREAGLYEVELRSRRAVKPAEARDRRELGVMVFSLGLAA